MVLSSRADAEPLQRHEPQIGRDLALATPAILATLARCLNDECPWPLTLLGPVGLGKSLAMLSFLDRMASDNLYWSSFARFCEEVDLAREGRLSFFSQGDTPGSRVRLYYGSAADFWKHVRRCSVCVLDEMGSRDSVTGPQYEKMIQLLDSRPAPAAPLILLSNLSLRDLSQIYDDRVASRLAAGTVVRLEGPDRRRTRREAPHATARDRQAALGGP